MQSFDLSGLSVTDDTLRACAWSPRGDRLAVCARDAVYVFSREAPSSPVRFEVGGAAPRCTAFSADGALLAVGTDAGASAVVVFDAATAAPRGSATAYDANTGDTVGRMVDLVTDVAFSPRGDALAVAGTGARAVFRAADGWGGAMALHDAGATSHDYAETTSLAFSPDGRAVLWCDESSFVRAATSALAGDAHPDDLFKDRGTSDLSGPKELGPLRPAGRASISADGRRTTLAMRRAKDGRAVLVRVVNKRVTGVVAQGDGASARLDAVHVDDQRGALWSTRKGALYRMNADTGALTAVTPCAGLDARRTPVAVVVSADGGSVARVYRSAIVATRIVAKGQTP